MSENWLSENVYGLISVRGVVLGVAAVMEEMPLFFLVPRPPLSSEYHFE